MLLPPQEIVPIYRGQLLGRGIPQVMSDRQYLSEPSAQRGASEVVPIESPQKEIRSSITSRTRRITGRDYDPPPIGGGDVTTAERL
jgi:hypothetical protein